MSFCDCASYPGGGAEESDPGGICKQTGHGSGNDAHWGGELSRPSRPQRQKMADLQDLGHKGHRPGWSNGMVGFTVYDISRSNRNKSKLICNESAVGITWHLIGYLMLKHPDSGEHISHFNNSKWQCGGFIKKLISLDYSFCSLLLQTHIAQHVICSACLLRLNYICSLSLKVGGFPEESAVKAPPPTLYILLTFDPSVWSLVTDPLPMSHFPLDQCLHSCPPFPTSYPPEALAKPSQCLWSLEMRSEGCSNVWTHKCTHTHTHTTPKGRL